MAPAPKEMPPRRVTLVLCTRAASGHETVLGALPAFDVDVPYWPETRSVVDGARLGHGVDVTVLRVLPAPPGTDPMGGAVAYLAEVSRPPDVPLAPWPGDALAPDLLRQTWAAPGGPDADLAWADAVLAERGTPRAGRPEQVKSWNLSSVHRLPLPDGAAWLKVVPSFFAHEGAVLARLARLGAVGVPGLLAHDGPRVLLDESPGADCYDATGPRLLDMVELLVGLQAAWVDHVDELIGLGAVDCRAPALTRAAVDTYQRTAAGLDHSTLECLEPLLAGLEDRFAAVAACGVPDTLVHGDFHPGNLIGGSSGAPLVLLDWGDCGAGHPLLDQAAFTGRLGAADLAAVRGTWARLWREAVPGSEPERAAGLLAPIAALRQATVYRMFLDHIEPSERIYHETDPARWLREAARLAAG
ncbi:MAG TPA: aminoglycoside phosphotransferase family protein [Actinomycetes bacterium]